MGVDLKYVLMFKVTDCACEGFVVVIIIIIPCKFMIIVNVSKKMWIENDRQIKTLLTQWTGDGTHPKFWCVWCNIHVVTWFNWARHLTDFDNWHLVRQTLATHTQHDNNLITVMLIALRFLLLKWRKGLTWCRLTRSVGYIRGQREDGKRGEWLTGGEGPEGWGMPEDLRIMTYLQSLPLTFHRIFHIHKCHFQVRRNLWEITPTFAWCGLGGGEGQGGGGCRGGGGGQRGQSEGGGVTAILCRCDVMET